MDENRANQTHVRRKEGRLGLRSIAGLVLVAALGFTLGGVACRDHESKPTATASSTPGSRKILYYKDPMGTGETSPVPRKDGMGMDYIPVYADDANK